MKTIIDYKIVYTDRFDTDTTNQAGCRKPLVMQEARVRKCIREGWQPFGPLRICHEDTSLEGAIQVMVKYADDEQYD